MRKKVLLWIDDNPYEEHRKFIQKAANKNGLEFVSIVGVSALQYTLEELIGKNDVVIEGIILDLMIYGANSLADFGYPEVRWVDATDVGEYLLKYVFRNKHPRQAELAQLSLPKKPVLILTVKSETRKEDFIKYGEHIDLIKKYDLDSINLNKRIRNWVNAL